MKKQYLLAGSLVLSLIILGSGYWYGGKEQGEVQEMNQDFASNPVAEKNYKKKLEEDSQSGLMKYNLANLYYRQNKFDESSRLLQETLNSKDADNQISQKSLYNLGNSTYQLAEKEEKRDSQIPIFKEALSYYRDAIEQEKSFSLKKDEDLHYNYEVTRQKLKILLDQKKKEDEQKEQQKNVYVLLKEISTEEKSIRETIQSLSSQPITRESVIQKNALLKRRKKNQEKLALVRAKLAQMKTPSSQPQQAPSSPMSRGRI